MKHIIAEGRAGLAGGRRARRLWAQVRRVERQIEEAGGLYPCPIEDIERLSKRLHELYDELKEKP